MKEKRSGLGKEFIQLIRGSVLILSTFHLMSLRGVRGANGEALSLLENDNTVEDFRLLRRAKALLAMTSLKIHRVV